MKKIFLFLCLLLSFQSYAQSDLHCGTDQVMKKLFDHQPVIKSRLEERMKARQAGPQAKLQASFTVPVVFHILHQGGPENISDAQVMDAINILNRDFAKANADTADIIPSFKQVADSTCIQFALATKDPGGNCTNGIVHYFDTDADWNDLSPTLYSHTWDPTMYMNVYVVRTISLSSGFSAAGYTYFPGSFPPGDPQDAIVLLHNYLGSIGTASVLQSRVLTHETGHWLNLMHVFGFNSAGADCFGDDFISDTPPTAGYTICPDASNPATYQLCSPGIDENFQNYMDYSYCTKMFTFEQGAAMQTALIDNIAGRDNLWSASNLLNTGITNPVSTCAPIANFKFDRTTTCVGVPVTFTDASWNGQPSTYDWIFSGGNPGTSAAQTQAVTYSLPGVYSVTLTTSNSAGSSVPETKTNIITVINNTAAYPTPWTEGFESTPIPNTDWTVTSSNGGSAWEQTFEAFYNGLFSARLPALNNTRKTVTSMISPIIDLSTVTDPTLFFKVAATEINPDHINNLQVLISDDCEQTWTTVFSKTGSSLVTNIDTIQPFIPVSQSQWRTEQVSLNAFSGADAINLKFMYTRDTLPSPSNIYIDDINIVSTTSINDKGSENKFTLYPNPAENQTSLFFTLNNKSHLTIYLTDITGRKITDITDKIYEQGNYVLGIGYYQPLSKGMYLVHIHCEGNIFTQKLIIN